MAENPNELSQNLGHVNLGSESNVSEESSAQDDLSVDQINAMLASEDPDFLERLTELKELPSQAEEIESVDIDATQLESESVPGETFSLSSLLVKLKHLIIGLPRRILLAGKGTLKFFVAQFVLFGELSWFNKAKVMLILFLLVGTTFAIFKFEDIATGKYFARFFQGSSLTSLEEVADESFKIESNEIWEAFSSPARRPNYYLLLPRIKIRLKTLGSDDHLSFATFEVFLEANSMESGVEIRDKESEILDLVQRAGENYTAEELLKAQFKQKLKKEIRLGTNLIMKSGFVREVHFNTILISP